MKFENKSYKGTNYKLIEVRKSGFDNSVAVYCNNIIMNNYPDEKTALDYISDKIEGKPIKDFPNFNYGKKPLVDTLMEIALERGLTILKTN